MVCEVDESTADELWPSILELRRHLKRLPDSSSHGVQLFRLGGVWRLAEDPADVPREASHRIAVPLSPEDEAAGAESMPDGDGSVVVFSFDRFAAGAEPLVDLRGGLDAAERTIFRLYLPLLVGGHRARAEGRLFVTAHLAQTLDGRIACRNGHSQWISNEANLHHAHRLRALHDAVVVGGRTVESDDPQLTVRHVRGDDPERVILNGSASVLRSPGSFHVFGGDGSTLLCHAASLQGIAPNGKHDRVSIVPVDCLAKPLIAPDTIRETLSARGMHSAFLEGGGLTISNYLQHRAIDVLHIHVAALVLGSGIPGLSLPEVSTVQAGRKLRMEPFAMDGELLLECRDLVEGTGSSEG
jgi:5-amino-6-(5-phosphoribosylamino)uracil reductase/diaminohydroxyphosphoribosylaminopyrimidine deaminase/5-amino-6-(5-phosphoribosylamino)uracil reductase